MSTAEYKLIIPIEFDTETELVKVGIDCDPPCPEEDAWEDTPDEQKKPFIFCARLAEDIALMLKTKYDIDVN